MDRYKILRNPGVKPVTSEDAEEQYIIEQNDIKFREDIIDFYQNTSKSSTGTRSSPPQNQSNLPKPVEEWIDKVIGPPWKRLYVQLLSQSGLWCHAVAFWIKHSKK
jgi:hypothetical protein